jgi:hypothetical protein
MLVHFLKEHLTDLPQLPNADAFSESTPYRLAEIAE